jgi:hypothetical protein
VLVSSCRHIVYTQVRVCIHRWEENFVSLFGATKNNCLLKEATKCAYKMRGG